MVLCAFPAARGAGDRGEGGKISTRKSQLRCTGYEHNYASFAHAGKTIRRQREQSWLLGMGRVRHTFRRQCTADAFQLWFLPHPSPVESGTSDDTRRTPPPISQQTHMLLPAKKIHSRKCGGRVAARPLDGLLTRGTEKGDQIRK